MSNNTSASTAPDSIPDSDWNDALKALWLTGIFTSSATLGTQLLILALFPRCRKYDGIILTQLVAARIVNTITEYILIMEVIDTRRTRDAMFMINFYTDFSLSSWMLAFTKNMFDKIIVVFYTHYPHRTLVVSCMVWASPIPLVIFLKILPLDMETFLIFYKVYCVCKLLVVVTNTVIFLCILRVAVQRCVDERVDRKTKDLLRVIVVCFVMLCVSCLQVLVTDVVAIFIGEPHELFVTVMCMLNSYQGCAVFVLFFFLVRGKIRRSRVDRIVNRNSLIATNTV